MKYMQEYDSSVVDTPTEVWDKACCLRRAFWGDAVFLRGIIEFSNYCRQNCLYCGLRRDNAGVTRYRLSGKDILDAAAAVSGLGIGTLVLQSGEDPGYDAVALAEIIAAIKKQFGLAITLSVGERSHQEYALWRTAGADRYLLKMETFDPALYGHMRPGCHLSARLDALESLRSLGYEIGTGLIAGLPGETLESVRHDMSSMADCMADMISISPFTPHLDTPLGKYTACTPETALQRMAMARVMVPTAHIPVTSALGLHGDAMRLRGLEVGDVLMPSFTPEAVRAAYSIYPGKNMAKSAPAVRAGEMQQMLLEHGFSLPAGAGGAWKAET